MLLNLDRDDIADDQAIHGDHNDNVVLRGGQYELITLLACIRAKVAAAIRETVDRQRGFAGEVLEIDRHGLALGGEDRVTDVVACDRPAAQRGGIRPGLELNAQGKRDREREILGRGARVHGQVVVAGLGQAALPGDQTRCQWDDNARNFEGLSRT